MKLIRYGEPNQERPGLFDNFGKLRDLSQVIPDLTGEYLLPDSIQRLRELDVNGLPEVNGNPRIGPCVSQIGKFICIGLNYSDHAAESGMQVPPEPVIFFKANSAVCGPNDNLIIPRGSTKTDWEVELGVVIGKPGKYLTEEEALERVAGYCVVHDVSERAFQLERSGQWVKGKSCDTFAPLGPFMATTDEIDDPHNLRLWLKLNGETMQDSSTSDLIFGIPKLVSYISKFMTLLPGDVISTGTPFGVGLGLDPQKYLKDGDFMELGIDGLGISKQSVKAYRK